MRPGIRRATLGGGPYLYHEWLDGYLQDQGYTPESIWGFDDEAPDTTLTDLKGNNDLTASGGPTLEASPLVDDPGYAASHDGVDDFWSTDSFSVGQGVDLTYLFWCQFDADQETNVRIGGHESNYPDFIMAQANDSTTGNLEIYNDTWLDTGIAWPQDADAHFIAIQTDFGNSDITAQLDDGTQATVSMNKPDKVGGAKFGLASDSGGNNLTAHTLDTCAVIRGLVSKSELDKIYDVGIDRSNR